jgi:hypothetical protein
MKASIPTRKKVKLEWFKSKSKLTIERKIDIQYTSNSVFSNKINQYAIVKYILLKAGEPVEIPPNSPMVLYKNNLPFLFLNISECVGSKIISEDMIDDDILVDDDIVHVMEGDPKISFEDAKSPKEHIEVRTRYDKISRIINIENKLEEPIDIEINFKQTKDITYIKSTPQPTEIEEPTYKFKISIPSESKTKITLELQAKIVKRVTKIKPEYLEKQK